MKQWMTFLLIATLPVATAAAGPGLINYQGRLTDSTGTPVTSPRFITFTLWSASSGGTPLGDGFSDTDTITPDDQGLYSTEIGDDGGTVVPASVFDNDAVWLSVNVGGEDLVPRLRITSAGYAADADTLQGRDAATFFNMAADAYVVVQTTASATQNGTNLLAAYAAARALTPGNAPLSTTNRAVLVVPPARYDLGAGSLTLYDNYVDLVGLTTARDSQYIFSSGNVLIQTAATAADVRIENLTFHYTGNNFGTFAYKPDGGSPAATTIRNCSFQATQHSMQTGSPTPVTYAGTYENCVATGEYTFGGNGGTASGTFTNCTGGNGAFGGYGGTASGTFTNCTGGNYSFGAEGGTASGVFTNCTGGYWSFAGYGGTASGKFTNCTGGAEAFGGYSGAASGTFTNCTGGNIAFGGLGTASGGKFYHCVGGPDAFTEAGATAPIHLFCIKDGAQYAGNN